MIISNNQIQNVLQNYKKQVQKANQKNVKNDKNIQDKGQKYPGGLSISNAAEAYQLANKVIKETPEVRENRLAEIKKAVHTGSYTVSNEEIAEKMIGRSIVDELV